MRENFSGKSRKRETIRGTVCGMGIRLATTCLVGFQAVCISIVITRDGKKLHLFGHLLRNKIAEIIAKIARKTETLHRF